MTDRGIRTAAPDPSARPKVIIGLALIIFSFVLGKIAVPVLAIQPTLSLLIYAISWIPLFVGAWICGREGLHTAGGLYKRYEGRVIGYFRGKLL